MVWFGVYFLKMGYALLVKILGGTLLLTLDIDRAFVTYSKTYEFMN
jgi:hypothetical protein